MGKTFHKVMMYMSPLYLITTLLMKGKKSKFKKGDISKIDATQAEEGSVIPVCYGTVKVSGNICYYGNVRTKTKNNSSQGSKGGGSEEQTEEVEYILDVHIILAKGSYTVNKIYNSDEEYTPNATILTNSTTLSYSSSCGTFAGLTHLFLKDWNIGNTTTVPNLSFSITRNWSSYPTWATPAPGHEYGDNPALIIYDIMTQCGLTDADIDGDSFYNAMSFWDGIGWELNWVFAEQKNMAECIADIFSQVPGVIYKNESDKYVLKHEDTNAVSELTLTSDDVKDCQAERQSLSTVVTDFAANYTDSNFVTRTCYVANEAVARQIGRVSKTYDYKGFRQENIQSRVNYDLRTDSYPVIKIKLKLPLCYSDQLFIGTVFTFEYLDFGLPNRVYRVVNIKKTFEELAIDIEAEEVPYYLVDAYSSTSNDHSEADYKTPPAELDYVYAVPYLKTDNYPFNSLLLLFVQKNGNEKSIDLYGDYTNTDAYSFFGNYTGFSQHAILYDDYNLTDDIDDADGIIIEIASSFDTSYINNITRYELFTLNRYVVIDDEIMKFQTATAIDSTHYKLLGVVRGSPQATHTANSNVYIGYVGNNILQKVVSACDPLKLKFLPKTKLDTLADATAISITYEFKPYPVVRIEAIRTGSTVDINIIPNTQQIDSGWGVEDETLYIDYDQPYPILGQLQYSVDGTNYLVAASTQLTITYANSFTFYVKHIYNGKESATKSVFVDTPDDIYIGG